MKIVYDSDNQLLEFDTENEYFKQTWKPSCERMSIEAYKNEMLTYIGSLLAHKPRVTLIDLCEFTYTIIPELQTWTVKNVHEPSSILYLEKTAFVTSPDFISQLSIEQTHEENTADIDVYFREKVKYFNELADAEAWLLG